MKEINHTIKKQDNSRHVTLNKKYYMLSQKFEQLETHFDENYHALWCVLKSSPAPVFTTTLLNNIRSAQDYIASLYHEEKVAPKYIIWISDNPKAFSLGIDINHIIQFIVKKDKSKLNEYLQLCIDVFYINLMKLDIKQAITISLIRGKAYGGGLEAALSSDIVFAETGSRCCFPEMQYNLLPTLGTLAMLIRKFNNSELKLNIFEGKQLSLDTLNQVGLIDRIVPDRQGEHAIYEHIKSIDDKHRVYSHLFREKSKAIMVSYQELEEFKSSWLDAALNLSDKDIRRLEKLAYAQGRKT